MNPATQPGAVVQTPATIRLGVVSFLNALPLIEGLDADARMHLSFAVPAALDGRLARGELDVALLPVVDFWRAGDRLQIVSDACIASDSETLTVRVFSRVPPDRVTRLHVDGDSHTSIVLARLIWHELYGLRLDCAAWSRRVPPDNVDAVLFIGDKVVNDAPRGYAFEVDLGGAWRHLTGLPFVFAVWAGQSGTDFSAAAAALSAARDRGVARAAGIAEQHGPRHGWPVPLARRYLCESLRYTLTPELRAGMNRFRQMCESNGFLSG